MRELNHEEKRVFSQLIIAAKLGSQVVRITSHYKRFNKILETWTTLMRPFKAIIRESNPKDKVFSVLDLKYGYFNTCIDPQLGIYFCFGLGYRKFSSTRLVHGFNCSPMYFFPS